MITAAIMQPTYLPWIGYFGLMDRVDKFVFLDSVQFAKRSWQQRNQIKTLTGASWLTVPVHTKGVREQSICDVKIVHDGAFPAKHIRSIETAYGKTPYFDRYADSLFSIFNQDTSSLAELSIGITMWIRNELGITTDIQRSSEMNVSSTKADLLANICAYIRAEHYVSPPGSKEYMDVSDAFTAAGIGVSYFDFEHPVYSQVNGDFLPYMSVLDLMFNVGPESLTLIRKSYRPHP